MWRYKQITAERDLSRTNFSNGEILFKYRMPSGKQINLDKSFIRIRCSLTDNDGNQLTEADDIAPNYLMAYNLFRNMYHCINGKEVSQIRAYVSQVGALRHRIINPQTWKDKFLASSNFAKIDFADRQNDVISSGLNLNNIQYRYPEAKPADAAAGTVPTFLELITPNQITFQAGGAGVGSLLFTPNAGTAIPDLSQYLQIGAPIYYNDGGEVAAIISDFATTNTTNDTIISSEVVLGVGVADLVNQFRYEQKLIDNVASKSKQSSSFELVFKPPMGSWWKNTWLPSHDMELKLYTHPDGTYQKNAIQSLLLDKEHGDNGNFLFNIEDMIMWVALKDEKHPDGDYDCIYEDMRCQLTNLTTTSNVDNQFVCDREAHSFTMALQDENVENNTTFSATQFKIRNDEQNSLQRYYISWNGRILPDPYPQISKTASEDFLTQRYWESTYYSGASAHQSVESQEQWLQAGQYFTHEFGKGRNQTEKVTVSTLFTDGAFAAGHRPNLLLFDHFTRRFKLIVSNGRVVEVYADKVN